MNKLKLQLTGIILLAAAVAIPTQAMAQWNLGVSYQIRQESPKNGFGIRIEREILQKLPLVDLRIRGHFAYFNEEIKVTRNEFEYSGKVAYYDYGLAGMAGISVGFLKPYVGLGIGASTTDIEGKDLEQVFNWSGFIGVELTPIPKLNPFIEYRFEPVDEVGNAFENAKEDFLNSNGRLIIGLSLSF